MRLIDADALVFTETYRAKNASNEGISDAYRQVLWDIAHCETIEAEPARHSENVTPYSGDENILCKECGFQGEVYEHEYDEYGNYVDAHGFPCKRCPHCGAKMDGGAK